MMLSKMHWRGMYVLPVLHRLVVCKLLLGGVLIKSSCTLVNERLACHGCNEFWLHTSTLSGMVEGHWELRPGSLDTEEDMSLKQNRKQANTCWARRVNHPASGYDGIPQRLIHPSSHSHTQHLSGPRSTMGLCADGRGCCYISG